MKKSSDSQKKISLPGVGKQIEKHLSRLEINSIEDLLFHLPTRYQDRTKLQNLNAIIPNEEAVIEGVIDHVGRPEKGRTKLLCTLKDGTGLIYLRFFNAQSFLINALKIGIRIRCYGIPKWGVKGLEMIHPEFKVIKDDTSILGQHFTAIYPATEGLNQNLLRKLITNALATLNKNTFFDEILPINLINQLKLPTFKEALQFIHKPPQTTDMSSLLAFKSNAHRRLIFEELLTHRISLLNSKQLYQSQEALPLAHHSIIQQFISHLPFQLTNAQLRVVNEIKEDLSRSYPMLRLLQGDVGSGKTIVASIAMLQAVQHGFQAAMMAPTELLAEQHFKVLSHWFKNLNVKVVFLSGSVKGNKRKNTLLEIEKGSAQIIIGTHALFQDEVSYSQLALLVTDEQHRFGVEQRALFRNKGVLSHTHPHHLMMTATPIPRTLAMSLYADLDISTIDELPPGRTPIMTSVISNEKRIDVINRIKETCQQGRQVYWVCPLIDDSESIICQSANQIAAQLKSELNELEIAVIHGRLKSSEKEAIMQAFKQNQIHLLVATTVIEVGVDVPNANVMIIENAERLGLSQLHQLRGRVGRGQHASYCILLYQSPLSPIAKERLSVIRETTDGFKIAQKDLTLRGPGEVLGTKQTGELNFKIANLMRDSDLLNTVHEAAGQIMQHHRDVIQPLMNRWLEEKQEYGKV